MFNITGKVRANKKGYARKKGRKKEGKKERKSSGGWNAEYNGNVVEMITSGCLARPVDLPGSTMVSCAPLL